MSNLFNSIFNDATATASPLQLMLALLVSLVLGLALTWTYKYRTLYTREFVISLTLLPCLMTLVIFLVNGSLGTSIAVAGTFSLHSFSFCYQRFQRANRRLHGHDYRSGIWDRLFATGRPLHHLSISYLAPFGKSSKSYRQPTS